MSGNHHHHNASSGRVLYLALILTFGFAIIEFIGGWFSNSLALMGDAGHMVTDAGSLLIAIIANWLSKKPPTSKHSYGLIRAEVVAALLNGLFMLLVIFSLVTFSIQRFQNPESVDGVNVMIIATIGLFVNIVVAYVLSRGEENINTKSALLHVMADLLGSVAALVSGIVIYLYGWMIIDPLLTIVICLLILFSTIHLLKEVLHIIMEGVPSHIDLNKVGIEIASIEKIVSVHDLHIWTLSSGKIALSAHIVLRDLQHWQEVFEESKALLNSSFHIEHITLQPELIDEQVMLPLERK